MKTLKGQCLCRAVTYQVDDDFAYAFNCHCSNCRRATGSAFKPIAGISVERLSITEGSDRLLIFGDEAGCDVRCADCGGFLYSVVRDGTFVHVAMGSLVDVPSKRPTAHIFVGSKAPWYDILDDLPQHEGFG